jgi:glycosyltransferase involved in cell wall biosynthesis
MGRLCVNLADVMTCTQKAYGDGMLLPWRRWRGHVIQATWVDSADVLPRDRAEARWAERLADPSRPLRVVFAANLLPGKGVAVLLKALELLDRRGATIHADIYGRGPLEPQCAEVAARLGNSLRLKLAGVLPYGPPFFEALDAYDLMVVPSLSDEQPRIIYDAFARALPVIASDTPGIRQCVEDGRTGRLVPKGDADALADALSRASSERHEVRDQGRAAVVVPGGTTHDRMHELRAALISGELSRASRPRRR